MRWFVVLVLLMCMGSGMAEKKYRNCQLLNQVYPYGVGEPGAKDRTRQGVQPVTAFKKDSAAYKLNKHLDRDKDKIACEHNLR